MGWEIAYLGVGANLGDRAATIAQAVQLLGESPDVEVLAVSELRETDPVGLEDQPRFLNGAVALRTSLAPRELLDLLLEVERLLGRTREGPRFGPRTIDLDLLVYEDIELDEPGLTVPHPRLHERRFALEPLAEVAPGLAIPGRGSVEQALAGLVVSAEGTVETGRAKTEAGTDAGSARSPSATGATEDTASRRFAAERADRNLGGDH
ncbi:MAG: 2-amino-4-hydroxy-6-hydroxymethyldihydropteridine diphosphokinase [Gaiellaceae bacterium]